MTTANLLVELFTEELPPRALKKLGTSFATLIADSLKVQGLAAADATVEDFATPRRLAVRVAAVVAQAADKPLKTKLMPVSVALDANGAPTQALLKKLATMGLEASAAARLAREGEGKTAALFIDTVATGVTLADGLQKALSEAIAKLPIPKVMQYQLEDGWTSVNFVRPVHGLVALHGADIVPVAALGLTSGRRTRGHRFEAQLAEFDIQSADSYEAQLRDQGAVIARFAERRAEIVRQLNEAAANVGGTPIDDDALLDEVTALVEKPNVLMGQFEEVFLAVPQECLILTMKANQKYFPLLDTAGKLTNQFLLVSNIAPADPSAVIEGNERVVRPRLADAKFFFDQDRKKSLHKRVPELAKVVYHNKLGSQLERTERVTHIAERIADLLGEQLRSDANQAAYLAKADLLTDMVGEFPELQGTMGRYYARNDGLAPAVADAIEDHYKPKFAGDDLPRNTVGVVVALADKLETLIGLFGIGEKPTGDKDPFALRRHALGVIRLLIERALPLSLPELAATAAVYFGARLPDAAASNDAMLAFVYERIDGYLREQGYGAKEADAVIAARPPWGDIPKRLDAVRAFASLPEAPALAAANKRVANILKKIDGEVGEVADKARLVEPAEIALFDALADIAPLADADFESGDYTASLQKLAALKAQVDAFFDSVMVNVDDPALKANRLALVNQLHRTMNRVADLAKLAA
jgi:glycyl-tRNA synthetase beta chain